MQIGLDIGSTTIKIAVMDDAGNLLFHKYERHYSQIAEKILALHKELITKFPTLHSARLAISGSGGIGVADSCGLQFVQEVFAEKICAEKLNPGTDAVIELGGEDAKILFLGRHFDARMNDSCAGGTGAFIDQMASLLNVETPQMNELAQQAQNTYTIASRCGVFAKSDIQPLLNQGAEKSDLAASIFHAVASQAITGLAKGRPISGNVLYLGGPLTFMSCLRDAFDSVLNIKGVCPENSLLYVAMGAAFCAEHEVDLTTLPEKLQAAAAQHSFEHLPPLFKNEGEYTVFKKRHSKESVAIGTPAEASEAFIGIDSGSTTIKIAVMSPDGKLLDSFYQSNKGNPVVAVRNYLTDFYTKYPNCRLLAGAVTGYGEDLIRHGFGVDYGIVETMAHFYAAQYLEPEVDFILDIGGQDMKCLKIHNGAIDNIFLNEACSSGCGSFFACFDFLSCADGLCQLAFRGTFVRTGTTFDTIQTVMFYETFAVTFQCACVQQERLKAHRAMFYAFTATDTVSFFGNESFFLCEAQQTGSGLNGSNIQSIQGRAHHRTAGNQFYGCVSAFVETADSVYHISQCHTDSDLVVTGVFDTFTGNGYDSSHQRSAFADSSFDGNNGINVVYDTASACRQCTGFHFSFCDSVNQVFFRTLREFGHQRLNSDVVDAFTSLCHGFDGFGLVHFDTDNAFCTGVQFQHDLQTFYDSFGFFQHQTVVACEVRFTFSCVDEDVIDRCVFGRVQFYMCGEARTTQTNNAGIFDCCQNFFVGHGCVISALVQTFDFFHLAVVFDNDGFYSCAAGYQHGSNVHNFTRYAGKDRRRHECR